MHSTCSRDKVYQLLAHDRWFSRTSSTTKTGRHDIAEGGVKHNKSNQFITHSPFYVRDHPSILPVLILMTFSGFWLILFHISFDIQFSFSVWFLLIISNVLHCCFQAICKSCTYILHVHFSISSPPPHIYVSKCVYVYVHISLFLPECACTTIIDISPRIFSLMYCCCINHTCYLYGICPPGALIWLINLFLFL